MISDRMFRIARDVCRDPGRFLIRFPFNLLPARAILSEHAMKMITTAVQLATPPALGDPDFEQDHFDELHRKGHDPSGKTGTAFIPGIGTVRACIDCGNLIAGGPTRCTWCVKKRKAHRAKFGKDPS